MNRMIAMALVGWTAACGGGGGGGDNTPGLTYTDPAGGALRLVKSSTPAPGGIMLDFVVGSAPVTGYSTGFDLRLDTTKVTLGLFTPGTALAPGTAPAAARAVIASQGALAGMLVVGQSQKASGAGAVMTDTVLAPGTVLFTVELDAVLPLQDGVVFDGTASGFVLPSGGLRNKIGVTVVAANQVAIGKLEVHP